MFVIFSLSLRCPAASLVSVWMIAMMDGSLPQGLVFLRITSALKIPKKKKIHDELMSVSVPFQSRRTKTRTSVFDSFKRCFFFVVFVFFKQRKRRNWRRPRSERVADLASTKSQKVRVKKVWISPRLLWTHTPPGGAIYSAVSVSVSVSVLPGRMPSSGDGVAQDRCRPAHRLLHVAVPLCTTEGSPQHAGTPVLKCRLHKWRLEGI